MAKIKPSSDLPRGSKSQFYIEGYELDVAEDVTSGHTTEEELAHVYGRDDPLKATNITGGTLSAMHLSCRPSMIRSSIFPDFIFIVRCA